MSPAKPRRDERKESEDKKRERIQEACGGVTEPEITLDVSEDGPETGDRRAKVRADQDDAQIENCRTIGF